MVKYWDLKQNTTKALCKLNSSDEGCIPFLFAAVTNYNKLGGLKQIHQI